MLLRTIVNRIIAINNYKYLPKIKTLTKNNYYTKVFSSKSQLSLFL